MSIQLQTLGLQIGKVIYPPSSFASAYIATTPQQELSQTLQKIAQKIKANSRNFEASTPILTHLVLNGHQKQDFSLETLKEFYKKHFKSDKIITREGITQNQKSEPSPKNQFSNIVESRRDGRKQRAYPIHSYGLKIYSIEDALRISFTGGSEYANTTLKRGNHWSEEKPHEKVHLDFLRENSIKDFDSELQLVDHTRAVYMTALANHYQAEHQRLNIQNDGLIFLPMNFAQKPELALEAQLMQYAPNKVIKQAQTNQETQASIIDVDEYFLGKLSLVLTEQSHQLRDKRLARNGGAIRYKSFSHKTQEWALLQAWEQHFMQEKNRHFWGYSIEFQGTPYQSVSMVYDFGNPKLPNHTTRSVRIIPSNDVFRQPVILYKVFNPEQVTGKVFLNERDPTRRVNVSRDNAKPSDWVYAHNGRDWTTGNISRDTLFMPSDSICKRAAQISFQGQSCGLLPEEFKEQYKGFVRNYR